jgi:uncharacterized protein (DUF4415 family)
MQGYRRAASYAANLRSKKAQSFQRSDFAAKFLTVEVPQRKADLHMRIDRDVLDFFRKTGRGHQTRINAVLRSYVEQARHRTPPKG